MDPLLSQLANLCATAPTQTKWVIVPSLTIGHMIGEQVARSGVRWANLRFTTPDDLARNAAGPVLLSQGRTVLSDGAGPSLVMRLLLDLPSAVPVYFRNMAHHPPMAQALWQTLSEIRMTGLTGADLTTRSWSQSKDKVVEFTALVQTYERYLTEHLLADRAMIYQQALAQTPTAGIRPDESYLEWPHTLWAPLQRRFLDALPGLRMQPATLDIPGLVPPRRLAVLSAAARSEVAAPHQDSDLLVYLLKPDSAPSPKADGSVRFFRAGSRDAEIEEIFRQIMSGSIALDDIEIACASSDSIPLVWEKANRYEWPITLGPGLPIALSRPGRALLALCRWIEQDFPASLLRRLLQSGDLVIDDESGPTASQAARLLAKSASTWGRDTYRLNLSALAQSYRTQMVESDPESRQHYEERVRNIDRLEVWITRLLELLPTSASPEAVPIGPWLDAIGVFLSEYVAKTSALDHETIAALQEALEELRVLGLLPPDCNLLTTLRGRVADLLVGAERAQPGHLYVTHLHQAGCAGRRYTFLVGIEESGLLPTRREDSVLLDDERVALDPLLATSQDRVSEAVHQLITRLAALSGRVCLSFACYDTRECRETFPSWIVLQAWRVLHPGETWTYQRLSAAIGSPLSLVSVVPEVSTSRSGWWLSSLRGKGPPARASVLQAFPDLAAGADAAAARASNEFTPYDGWVPQAGLLLNPLVTGEAVSATSLEELATCPFRYFLRRGLHLDTVEHHEPTPDVWLDPMTRGVLLHQLYAAVLREQRRRLQWTDAEAGDWIQTQAQQELERLRGAIPPSSEELYARERASLLQDLRLFLQFERRDPARQPIGFEVAFGLESDSGEDLSSPNPVSIQLGALGALKIRGRIDRLDRLPDGTYEVIDYKTGSVRLNGNVNATFAGGRQLQHALYALATAELLNRQVGPACISRSSYYFPTQRGKGDRIVRTVDPDGTRVILRDLIEIVQDGTFVQTTDESDCKYCDYQRACGATPSANALSKVTNQGATALDPYRKLTGHA